MSGIETVLGFDTSTTVAAIGIVGPGGLRAGFSTDIRATHSERLLPAIDDLLSRSGLNGDSLDGIAVSLGPGSYTGLRIGIGTAKA